MRDDHATRLQEALARVVERGNDVFLEGVVAERLAHDEVDTLGARDISRMHDGNADIGEAVVAQELARDARDLGRLVEIDPLGAELCRQEAEESRAGTDVGNGGIARHDGVAQRRVKGGIADAVGEQRAVVLDAHAKWPRGAPVSMRNTYTIGHYWGARARWHRPSARPSGIA